MPITPGTTPKSAYSSSFMRTGFAIPLLCFLQLQLFGVVVYAQSQTPSDQGSLDTEPAGPRPTTSTKSSTFSASKTIKVLSVTRIDPPQTTLDAFSIITRTLSTTTSATPSPIQLAGGNRGEIKPETPEEKTQNDLLNLYFLLLGVGVVIVAGGLHIWQKKRSEKRVRSVQRGQNALRRDLELGGWSIGVNGIGRWGSTENRQEGLDERGEAPPPYSARDENRGGVPLIPLPEAFIRATTRSLSTTNLLPTPGRLASANTGRSLARRSISHLRSHSSTARPSTSNTRNPRLPTYEDIASSSSMLPAVPPPSNPVTLPTPTRRSPTVGNSSSNPDPPPPPEPSPDIQTDNNR